MMASSATATATADGGHENYHYEAAPITLVPDVRESAESAPVALVRESTARREVHAAGHEWEWQLHGECRSLEPEKAELFFHPWGERDPSRGRRDRAAKQICASCPVMMQCRDYALATREPYGVWGGLSEHDREEILGVRFG
jgi:WhiB family redox-sensing transcriptional regulator